MLRISSFILAAYLLPLTALAVEPVEVGQDMVEVLGAGYLGDDQETSDVIEDLRARYKTFLTGYLVSRLTNWEGANDFDSSDDIRHYGLIAYRSERQAIRSGDWVEGFSLKRSELVERNGSRTYAFVFGKDIDVLPETYGCEVILNLQILGSDEDRDVYDEYYENCG